MAVEFTELEARAAAAVLDAEALPIEVVLAADSLLEVDAPKNAGLALVELKSELHRDLDQRRASSRRKGTDSTHLQVSLLEELEIRFVKVM